MFPLPSLCRVREGRAVCVVAQWSVRRGSRDDVCPPETVLAWKQLCASPDQFRSVEVDGGHMFINPTQCGAVVLKEIAAVLKGL